MEESVRRQGGEGECVKRQGGESRSLEPPIDDPILDSGQKTEKVVAVAAAVAAMQRQEAAAGQGFGTRMDGRGWVDTWVGCRQKGR
ncbi:hypothetical protein E2C01_088014 [Portunus trituberculatus]|uniref:Uncharacterized protein n=1 Tax=Portunus trituberculatus TaxID=210409 RepID=A0A5B7J508_PORTR|nr:hypothetical protein [Portunus trituberculatus]